MTQPIILPPTEACNCCSLGASWQPFRDKWKISDLLDCWSKDCTHGGGCNSYVDFVLELYKQNSSVVFNGNTDYKSANTKKCEHDRRSSNITLPDIVGSLDAPMTIGNRSQLSAKIATSKSCSSQVPFVSNATDCPGLARQCRLFIYKMGIVAYWLSVVSHINRLCCCSRQGAAYCQLRLQGNILKKLADVGELDSSALKCVHRVVAKHVKHQPHLSFPFELFIFEWHSYANEIIFLNIHIHSEQKLRGKLSHIFMKISYLHCVI